MIDLRSKWRRIIVLPVLVLAGSACSETPITQNGLPVCDLDQDLLVSNLAPNAIRALTLPTMVFANAEGADYLLDGDRVLGVYVNGEARAYPHPVLWYHEIVNDSIQGEWVTVSFCPLTGSGLGFDPVLGGTRLDVGVSGLLFANNLIMYDRLSLGVYGPQLGVEATCQGFSGQAMALVPVQEMSWGRWKELHPDTKVVSSEGLSSSTPYRTYPYGGYDQLLDARIFFQMPLDNARPLKERVLAVRVDGGGRGFPFGELEALGAQAALNETIGGVPTAIFYEQKDGGAALAFDARVGTQILTFDADPSGVWTDRETGSTWTLDGTATAGPLAGERLATRADAYTLFWFAWRHFEPDATVFAA